MYRLEDDTGGGVQEKVLYGHSSEGSSLLGNKTYKVEGDIIDESQKYPTSIRFLVPFFVMAILGAVAYTNYGGILSIKSSQNKTQSMTLSALLEKDISSQNEVLIKKTSLDNLAIWATNEEYGHYKGAYSFLDIYPGSHLVEPYKETTLSVMGALATEDKHNSFFWKIDGLANGLYEGANIKVTFTRTGIFDVVVHSFHLGEYVSSFSSKLIVKYVKREIRELTESDRDKFLDAAHEMWRLDGPEGQMKYGPNFIPIHTFVAEHAIASNNIMCDEFHDGSGFLTHHLALHNAFEASLRAIDPSVTLPYWDFTIEGEAIAKKGGVPSDMLKLTPVFTAEWFGSVDENNHIADGRWAHQRMPTAEVTDTVKNSYGFLRAIWNNNDDPEITRHLFDVCGVEAVHKKIPSCAAHQDLINTESLTDFLLTAPSDGHGPMHVQIGGVWGGCSVAYTKLVEKWHDVLDEDISDEDIIAMGFDPATFANRWGTRAQRKVMLDKSIMGEYFHIYRGLWRSHICAQGAVKGLLECPASCTEGTPFEECSCSVPKLRDNKITYDDILPCLLNSDENMGYFKHGMPASLLKDIVNMVTSSSVREGEMDESASPADILFWMVHTSIERVLAAKRLPGVTKLGSERIKKWKVVDGSAEEWKQWSMYDFQDGFAEWHDGAYECRGHSADSPVLPSRLHFTHAIKQNADADHDGVITNWEFYKALDPNDMYVNDYVFDDFQWDHCD